MAVIDAPSRLMPLAEELLDNAYARKNLREGTEKLRDVYGRAQKRRVRPSRDRTVSCGTNSRQRSPPSTRARRRSQAAARSRSEPGERSS